MSVNSWKPVIDRLCKRLGYRMRCQRSPRCKRLTLRRWSEPAREQYLNGVRVTPKPEHGFYLVLDGWNYQVWLARRIGPTLDAPPCTLDHILTQLLVVIDRLAKYKL